MADTIGRIALTSRSFWVPKILARRVSSILKEGAIFSVPRQHFPQTSHWVRFAMC